MICPADPSVLLEYAAGRLEPATAALLARHIESCDACAEIVLGHSMVSEALDLWEAPPVSTDFNRRLWQRIDVAESAPWYAQIRNFFRFGSLKSAIPVAAGVLVIAAGFLMDHPVGSAAHPAARVSVTEVDQAERTLDDIQMLRQFNAAVGATSAANTM